MIHKDKLDKFFSVTDFNVITPLCESMCRHGSDKGRGIHNYTKFYNYIFSGSKEKELNIFEVGLGTDNTTIESNMGAGYNVGASLYGWEEYFTNSKIYGADVDKNILFNRGRITTYFVDQLDTNSIKSLLDNTLKDIDFDIIIDDGLHKFEANNNFLHNSIHKLKKGGVYIIEDVYEEIINKFKPLLTDEFFQKNNLKTGRIFQLPHPTNSFDNNLIVLVK
jgi:SAM-dependent methyltransferase